MFKINEFSKLTTISPRMLRYYDKLNLLKPEIVQKENGYRYYSPEQINQANRLLSLKNVGIPLKEIKPLLDNNLDLDDYLIKHRNLLETELAEKKLQLAFLNRLEEKNTNSNINEINYPIEIKMMNERFVLSYRQKVNSYYDEEQLWQKLFSKVRTQDLAKLSQSIAIFHSDDVEVIDIEVMISIPERLSPVYPEAILFSPGPIASTITTDTYSMMPKVHADMNEWLRLNDYVRVGNIFNIYHSSPATEERGELYITEVCYPLK